jgi:multiple sugar transport system substrate-binding protein
MIWEPSSPWERACSPGHPAARGVTEGAVQRLVEVAARSGVRDAGATRGAGAARASPAGCRLTKRRALALGGSLVLAAACGRGGSQGSESPAAPAAAPVKLLYWTQRPPDDRLGNGVKAALDDYVASHPGKITLEVGEDAQAVGLEKIKTAIAGGTQPDLYGGLYQGPAVELFTLGAVVDLNRALQTNKDWAKIKGELLPTNVDGCSWKGKFVMMPMMLAQQVLGLNKQLMAKVGVPLPATGFTWNDFVEVGRKVSLPGERWLYPWQYTWSDYNSWIYSDGLAPISADHTKVLFDTPPMLETLQWLHDQATAGQVFRPGAAANADFDTGKFVGWSANEAAGIQPVRFPNVDSGDGAGLFITHYPIGPSNTRKQIITYANVYGLIALKSSDPQRVAQAAEVTGWGGRSDVQMKIAAAAGHVPPNTVAARPENLPAKITSNPILNTIAEYGKYSYLTPNYPSWTNSMTILQDNFMRVMKGEMRPKDALADAQPKIQAAVDDDLRAG